MTTFQQQLKKAMDHKPTQRPQVNPEFLMKKLEAKGIFVRNL